MPLPYNPHNNNRVVPLIAEQALANTNLVANVAVEAVSDNPPASGNSGNTPARSWQNQPAAAAQDADTGKWIALSVAVVAVGAAIYFLFKK
jgi:hypothetical protein